MSMLTILDELQMRQEMVSQKEGEMELQVLTHMDDMKRVSLRTQK